MKTRTTATLAGATITLATITLTAPAANAATYTYSNQSGDVRCEIYNTPQGHTTLCVSDKARKTQPECNPPEHLIPAVKVEDNWVGTLCWNQGFIQGPDPR